MWPYAVVTGTNHEGTMIHKSFTFHVIEYESLYRGHALSRSIVLCTLTRAGRGRSVGAMYWLTAPAPSRWQLARPRGIPHRQPAAPRHRTRIGFYEVVVPYSLRFFTFTCPAPARQTALFLSSITTLVFTRVQCTAVRGRGTFAYCVADPVLATKMGSLGLRRLH